MLTQRAVILLLVDPPGDAVSVVSVVASPPGNEASISGLGIRLCCLAFDACFVYSVLADCTVLDLNIPSPESHSVPLLYLDSLVNLHLKIRNYYKQSENS